MNRVIAGTMGLLAAGTILVGCSDDKPQATPSPAAADVKTGGNTQVKVDGKDLPGLDLNSVTCVKEGGRINVGSAAIGGQQGLGVVMTDEASPKVESLGLVYDAARSPSARTWASRSVRPRSRSTATPIRSRARPPAPTCRTRWPG